MKKISSVLVVDDSRIIRMVLTRAFTAEGIRSVEAKDGAEAWEYLREHVPDAIVCDINMPTMDGWELCWRVRQARRLRHIPFLFLTARGETTSMERGVELGADDYMVKPVTPEAVLEHLRAILTGENYALRHLATMPKASGPFGGEAVALEFLVKEFCVAGACGELTIRGRVGYGDSARLEISNGNLVRASYRLGQLSGVEALRAALSIESGIYRFLERKVEPGSQFTICTLRLLAEIWDEQTAETSGQ